MSLTPVNIDDHSLICISPSNKINLNKIYFDEPKSFSVTLLCEIKDVKITLRQIQTEDKFCRVEIQPRTFCVRTLPTEKRINISVLPIYPVDEAVIEIEVLINPTSKRNLNDVPFLNTLREVITIEYETLLSNWINPNNSEIEIIGKLGEGKEGKVLQAIYNKETVAIKRLLTSEGKNENEMFAFLKNEYVVNYICSYYSELNGISYINIVMEYAPFGCLLNKTREISDEVLLKIMEDISRALKFLHVDKHIIHRDVKPQNILLFNWTDCIKVNAKLTDFGISRTIDTHGIHTAKLGTQNFTAPEVIRNEKYSYPCDIYSLGMTMYFSFTKIDPFDESISKVMNRGNSIPKHPRIFDNIWGLITKCCDLDQSRRPSITECLTKLETIRSEFKILSISKNVEVEQKEVRFSFGSFDLLEAVQVVVESIHQFKVENPLINALLKLKFNKDSSNLEYLYKHQELIDNRGDIDYFLANHYITLNDCSLITKIRKLMISAASKLQPHAILYLVDLLEAIAHEKIIIYDDTGEDQQKNRSIFDEVCLAVSKIQPIAFPRTNIPNSVKNGKSTISSTIVVDIFSALKDVFPSCKMQFGKALLHGVGVKENISNAEILFVQLKNAMDVDALFYEALCQLTPHHTQQQHESTFELFKTYLLSARNKIHHSDVLNNQGVFLFKGWGRLLDKKLAIKKFKESTKMDNLYGMFNLAYCLLNGDGCEKNSKNTKKGLEYLKKAALKGLDIAQLLYANRLHQQLTGDDPQRSIKDSVYWYTKAAFQGNFVSMNNLGHCFFKGKGVEVNNQLAFQLFSIAASKGNEKAQINLALCYLWGKGIRRNEDQAVSCYKNAAEKGNAEAQMKLAKFLIGQYKQRQDPEIINEALRMLEMASKQGNAQAMFNYGLCFYKGIGVPRNELKAFDLFKASAFKKDPDALYVLGQIYFDGKSVVEDKTLALDYMQQAAVLNNTQAMYHIGICYLSGIGKPIDFKKAMDYFNQASDRGFVVATLKIAQLLLHGYEKIPMDKDKAIDLYKDLANKGNAKAQFSLGECYLKGDGVERDIERATYWFQTSSANNYTPASQQLLLLNYEIY